MGSGSYASGVLVIVGLLSGIVSISGFAHPSAQLHVVLAPEFKHVTTAKKALELSQQASKAGQIEAAIRALRHGCALDKSNPDVHAEYGRLLKRYAGTSELYNLVCSN